MMLTNLIDALYRNVEKMVGNWSFSDSWHVTGLWEPESICSSSRCVCTLHTIQGLQSVVVEGKRSVLRLTRPLLVSAFKDGKRRKKERKSATNHDGIDCFASKRPRDFGRVVAHQKP
jgi:hypothetical protein